MKYIHYRGAWLIAMLLFISIFGVSAQESLDLRIGFLNGYNLFDTINQPEVLDGEYTPEGKYRWTTQKYWAKIEGLSQKISQMRVDILGVCEVENRAVLEDLVRYSGLNYHIIHYESSDLRGIDLALLYDPQRVEMVESGLVAAPTERLRRESLWCRVRVFDQQIINIVVLHQPSRLGGRRAREDRERILEGISSEIASRAAENFVVMGDFNETRLVSLPPLVNVMEPLFRAGRGSYSYYGVWSLLDQILVSASLLQRTSTPVLHNERRNLHRAVPSSAARASDHAGVSMTLRSQ